MSQPRRGNGEDCLAGGGEAGELARRVDWAKTTLGPVSGWSQALRSAAALVLHNHQAMLLWWGPKFVQLYNDASRPVLGDKHPRAMGQPFSECWKEVFHTLGPLAESPFRGGPARTSDDVPLLLDREVPREEAHFRIACSPVPDETVEGTGIGGVLAVVTEITEQVYGERQLRTLRELGAHGAVDAKTVESSCQNALATLRDNAWDVPFALLYLLEGEGKQARLAATVGFGGTPVPDTVAPALVELSLDRGSCPWPIRQVLREQEAVVVNDLAGCASLLPRSPWSAQPRSAIALPLAAHDEAEAYGVVVFGVSPHRPLDAAYRGFFELATAQMVTLLRNARALETKRKRAEALAEIDGAKSALERAIRLSEMFVGILGHDLRNPLSAIMTSANLLQSRADSERIAKPVARIVASADRMERMISQLLDFTRWRLGEGLSLEPKKVDLQNVARLVIDELDAIYGQELELVVDGTTVGIWDEDRLAQLLSNLAANACQHGTRGSPVRVRVDGARQDTVEIEVTSAGMIPSQLLPTLFEPLQHSRASEKRPGKSDVGSGLGLGLFITRQIALAHGGSIQVASDESRGTSFIVRLPRHPIPSAANVLALSGRA